MQFSAVILHLAGAVVLLLYSTRLVRTGLERASGPALRDLLLTTRRNTIMNVVAGVFVAIFLQSSTAVALLVSDFAASGLLGVAAALSILLGADLGTAIVVQILSFNLGWLIPALLVIGGLLFLRVRERTLKQTGRAIIGVAFILLSLKMIGEATIPLRENPQLPLIVGYLSQDVVSAFVLGGILAFAFHSSVAAVLLFAAFSAQGLLPIDAGLPLVLGANAGGGLVAVWLTRMSNIKARRITAGNFIFRGVGAVIVLVAIQYVDLPYQELGSTETRQLVNFHLLFNAALVVFCLPLVSLLAKVCERLIRDPAVEDGDDLKPASALDRGVFQYPELALASVTRELLRMAGIVEVMVTPIMDFFVTSSPKKVNQIKQLDLEVNKAHTEIKLYIAELGQGELEPDDVRRCNELTAFAVNLERVGDIVAKDLLSLTVQMHKNGLKFSDEGREELTSLHERVMANTQLALNVLVSEDLDSAKQLIEEKDRMRKLERESHARHLARLGSGTPESIATSDIHLETMRALREINSRFAGFAYPILDKSGVLLDSRLASEVR